MVLKTLLVQFFFGFPKFLELMDRSHWFCLFFGGLGADFSPCSKSCLALFAILVLLFCKCVSVCVCAFVVALAPWNLQWLQEQF